MKPISRRAFLRGSGLALALPLLGYRAADGVALSLLIRGRDMLLAGLGLGLGQRALRHAVEKAV